MRIDDDEFHFEMKTKHVSNDELVFRQQSPTPFIWKMMESESKTLDPNTQIIFLIIFSIIVGVSFFGNLLTIIVLLMRKQRFLFKICLFSLAVSDFVFTISTGFHYIIKLLTGATPLWQLGWLGCMVIPFFQTVSVLTGSMSLVLIALDRFLAVRNKSNEKLLQSKMFCLGGIIFVWLLGCGISSPVLFVYEYNEALVIPDGKDEKFAYHGHVCITDPDESSEFYIVVFTFIFFPVFVGFIWLNTIISREIWKRRDAPGQSNQRLPKSTTTSRRKTDDDSKDSSALEMKNTDDTNTNMSSLSNRAKGELAKKSPTNISIPSSQVHSERQRRQMRMFKVILILMTVFICCRLPNWIFLFYKLKHNVSSTLNWILLYTFASMGLLNCMLNPFLYTFLNETIRITSYITEEFQRFINIFCHRRRNNDSPQNTNNQQMFANNFRRNSDGGIYLGV